MKKILFLLAVVSVNAIGQNIEKLDEKKGFQQFILGAPKTTFSKMKAASYRDKNNDSYDIKKVKFGDYLIDEVSLTFFHDSLMKIEFTLMAMDGGAAALNAFKNAYGDVQATPVKGDNIKRYIWIGNSVKLQYEHYEKGAAAYVRYDYLPLLERQKAEREKARPKVSTSDL